MCFPWLDVETCWDIMSHSTYHIQEVEFFSLSRACCEFHSNHSCSPVRCREPLNMDEVATLPRWNDQCKYHFWLVVWLPSICYFPINIGKFIIPIDEIIFFRGVARNHQPVISCGIHHRIPLNMLSSMLGCHIVLKDHPQPPPLLRQTKAATLKILKYQYKSETKPSKFSPTFWL